jgi:hypothetical protein
LEVVVFCANISYFKNWCVLYFLLSEVGPCFIVWREFPAQLHHARVRQKFTLFGAVAPTKRQRLLHNYCVNGADPLSFNPSAIESIIISEQQRVSPLWSVCLKNQ